MRGTATEINSATSEFAGTLRDALYLLGSRLAARGFPEAKERFEVIEDVHESGNLDFAFSFVVRDTLRGDLTYQVEVSADNFDVIDLEDDS